MNCYLHPDTPATAFCRSCGRPLCALCQKTADGVIYCQDHVPVPAFSTPAEPNLSGAGAAANPYFQAAPTSMPGVTVPPASAGGVHTSPGLAFVLGFIPGVGAIYNGQYLKGLVHAIILGVLISLASSSDGSSGQPLIVMCVMAFVFYMPFEAYHTAKKRQLGVPTEEWSSLVGQSRTPTRAPIGPILLIMIGVLFLLDTMNVIRFRDVGRFWPVLLIAVGAYMLWSRVSTNPPAPVFPPYSSPVPPPYSSPVPPPYSSPADSPNPMMGARHE